MAFSLPPHANSETSGNVFKAAHILMDIQPSVLSLIETISQMQFIPVISLSYERIEKYRVGNMFACNDFRFLTTFGMTR